VWKKIVGARFLPLCKHFEAPADGRSAVWVRILSTGKRKDILLVSAFSSDQKHWIDLECINVHDGKKYRIVNCKESDRIPQNAVFPSQFARLLIDYQEHPEAKSLGPDGNSCKADTRGLLKRARVTAGEIRYVGKMGRRR
jgi:hypothetical protein